jgi:hypothetical protein
MKRVIFRGISVVFAIILAIILFIAVTPINVNAHGHQNNLNPQESTPTPTGQLNVPGFSIQIHAPGPNVLANTVDSNNRISGLAQGIWHGIISPITLCISFFDQNVQMYEVHNDGSPYNVGFLIGVAIVFLLLGVFAGSRRH